MTLAMPIFGSTTLPTKARFANTSAVGQRVIYVTAPVPEAEAWLWRNPVALAMVQSGIEDSRDGRIVRAGSFADAITAEDKDA